MPTLLNNRYQVLKPLGSGGCGITFLAEDIRFTHLSSRRFCVVKQLQPAEINRDAFQIIKERFQKEAEILEILSESCPQIPKYYAHFTEDEQFYLVQEWVEGETLATKLEAEGKFSEPFVKEILVSLLTILKCVHSHCIHRDINHNNIILRKSDGKPVLIDFGLVKEVAKSKVDSQGHVNPTIVVGQSGFKSPEQSAGRPVYSSDLYSLGMTAIYMLTGKHPQYLDTDPHTGEILWRVYAQNVSSRFADVLDKAVQTYAIHRYSTAQEMLDALGQVSLASHEAEEEMVIDSSSTELNLQPTITDYVIEQTPDNSSSERPSPVSKPEEKAQEAQIIDARIAEHSTVTQVANEDASSFDNLSLKPHSDMLTVQQRPRFATLAPDTSAHSAAPLNQEPLSQKTFIKRIILAGSFPPIAAAAPALIIFMILNLTFGQTSANLDINFKSAMIIWAGLTLILLLLQSVLSKNKDLIELWIESLTGFFGGVIGCFAGAVVALKLLELDLSSLGSRFIAGCITMGSGLAIGFISFRIARAIIEKKETH